MRIAFGVSTMSSTTNPNGSGPKSTLPLKKHICGSCQKAFDTKQKQKQHRRDAHIKATTRTSKKARPAPQINVVSHRQVVHADVPTGGPKETRPVSQVVPSSRRLAAPTGELNNVTTTPGVPQPAPLSHMGISYTTLSTGQKVAIQAKLSTLCHSEQRLKRERYTIPEEPHTTSTYGPKLASVVIDCEMAGTANGQSELIHISAIDFLSGQVLLNHLVRPARPITDWRTCITGIDSASMQAAIDQGTALAGYEEARAELWKLADKNTILIGQSLQNDLRVLHTSHAKVIDTAIMFADAVLSEDSNIRKRWGLETLCREVLGIRIRQPPGHGGNATHDSLEDVLATRELVLLSLLNPDKVSSWAEGERKVFRTKKAKPKGSGKKKKKKTNKKTQKSRNGDVQNHNCCSKFDVPERYYHDYEDEEFEVLRWEDVVPWDVWPKSPPDSD